MIKQLNCFRNEAMDFPQLLNVPKNLKAGITTGLRFARISAYCIHCTERQMQHYFAANTQKNEAGEGRIF